MNEKEKKQQNSRKQQTRDNLAEEINWAIHFTSDIYCIEVLSLTNCKVSFDLFRHAPFLSPNIKE